MSKANISKAGYDIKNKKFSILNLRLRQLFIARWQKVQSGGKIDFVEDDGLSIYNEAVEEICKMLCLIKELPQAKLDGCALFNHVEDKSWQKDFKENLYKIFIDRIKCKEDVSNPQLQFNRSSLEANKRGSDLCYGEAFAVAFLFMLHRVYEELSTGNKDELSGEKILKLLSEFNAIAVGGVDLPSDQITSVAYTAFYGEACNRKKVQEQFGKSRLVYYPEKQKAESTFREGFNHAECAAGYYEDFLQKESAAKDDKDIERSIFDLVDLLGSNVHLRSDGNDRTAMLLGWFLAIKNNVTLPIGIFRSFFDDEVFESDRDWTKSFLNDPKTSIENPDLFENLKKVFAKIKDDLYEQIPVGVYFLYDLFSDEIFAAKIEVSMLLGGDLFVSEFSDYEYGISSSPMGSKSFKINTKLLHQAIEENKENILAEKNLVFRNQMIAEFFVEQCQKSSDPLSKETVNLLNVVEECYEVDHSVEDPVSVGNASAQAVLGKKDATISLK